MPASQSYNAITVQSQIVHNTPWFQRVYSSHPPTLEEEIENKITQQVSNEDLTRVPSGNAVHDFVVNYVDNHAGIQIVDELIDGELNKAPSTNVVYNALQNKASKITNNEFLGINLFSNSVETSVNIDIFDELNNNKIPNAKSVRDFVVQALSDETVKYVFSTPSTVWNINHDRDTDIFHEKIYDVNNTIMYAPIEIVDNNNFRITFTEAVTGYVIVKF